MVAGGMQRNFADGGESMVVARDGRSSGVGDGQSVR